MMFNSFIVKFLPTLATISSNSNNNNNQLLQQPNYPNHNKINTLSMLKLKLQYQKENNLGSNLEPWSLKLKLKDWKVEVAVKN